GDAGFYMHLAQDHVRVDVGPAHPPGPHRVLVGDTADHPEARHPLSNHVFLTHRQFELDRLRQRHRMKTDAVSSLPDLTGVFERQFRRSRPGHLKAHLAENNVSSSAVRISKGNTECDRSADCIHTVLRSGHPPRSALSYGVAPLCVPSGKIWSDQIA